MRIGIVNAQMMVAEAMRRVILRAGKHDVAWIAHNGAEAVAYCERDRPDLVLMDLFMPRMDGVETTRRIMARTPCAVIVAAARVEDHTASVFEAMGAGALDAVSIGGFARAEKSDVARRLLAKIEIIHSLLGPERPAARPRTAPMQRLVAIGASAGGPTALAAILAALPGDFPAAVVIVQHVDKRFAQDLTMWLGTRSKLPVRVAQGGERIEPGTVFLAGRDRHLVLSNHIELGYTSHPQDVSYCPSVDVFFQSVARQWRGAAVGVLLTGMGRDGAVGLKALREAGHHTIAQDKNTSAVFGMPKAASELGAAGEILALDKIGPRLTNIARTN